MPLPSSGGGIGGGGGSSGSSGADSGGGSRSSLSTPRDRGADPSSHRGSTASRLPSVTEQGSSAGGQSQALPGQDGSGTSMDDTDPQRLARRETVRLCFVREGVAEFIDRILKGD